MPNRVEYSRKKPGENPHRPDDSLYTVDHASKHNGVWFPDAFRCTISSPEVKYKAPPPGARVGFARVGTVVDPGKGANAEPVMPEVGSVLAEKSTLVYEIALSDIRIGGLTDSDFQLKTKVPDGMTVDVRPNEEQSKFKWRDGTVVRED